MFTTVNFILNILLIKVYSINLLFSLIFSPKKRDYAISPSRFLILSCNSTLSWWIFTFLISLLWVDMFWCCVFWVSHHESSLSLYNFGLIFFWVNYLLVWKWEFEFISKHNLNDYVFECVYQLFE